MVLVLVVAAIYAVSVGLGCALGWGIAAPILRRMDDRMMERQAVDTLTPAIATSDHIHAVTG